MPRLSTLALYGALLVKASCAPTMRHSSPPSVSSFAEIPASKELTWVPCYDSKFLCANLEVPLDYADLSVGNTTLAWIKMVGGDGSGPDVLYNPGGPGGSGVDSVIGSGAQIIAAFGGVANLVSWDPRGVKNSGPHATCFENTTVRDAYYLTQSTSLTTPVSERWQRSVSWGKQCSGTAKYAKYIGTAAVAQDMRHFIERQAIINGKDPKEAKLWYYGVSYGTLLGQTFAAMFPDLVERMVLDANVNGQEYYQGNVESWVEDADEAMRSFFDYCFEAGVEKCAYASNATSATDIEARYQALLQALEEEPLIAPDQPIPTVLTRVGLESVVFRTLYSPITMFPELAQLLILVEQGNTTVFPFGQPTPEALSEPPNPNYKIEEAQGLISCTDINSRYYIKSRAQFEEVYARYQNTSFYGGNLFASTNALGCAGFTITPPENQIFPEFAITETNHPILFVGGTRDPVTPLSSAFKNAKYFKGSEVLTHNSTGHGILSTSSKCLLGHFQAYLSEGTLPPPNTICEADVKPLVDPVPTS